MDDMERKQINELFANRYSDPSARAGYGITATVFLDRDIATKVYSKTILKRDVFKEAYMLAFVEQAGINTSKVLDVRYENGFWMLQMTAVKGQAMLNTFLGKLTAGDFSGVISDTERMADIQAVINRADGTSLPSYKSYAASVISGNPALTQECKDKLCTLLRSLPDGTALCHGDLHPNNILVSGDGDWTVIDWPEVTCGSPCADACRTYVNMCRFSDCTVFLQNIPDDGEALSGLKQAKTAGKPVDLMSVYLERYCSEMGIDQNDILRWIPVQAGMLYGYKEADMCAFLEPYLP